MVYRGGGRRVHAQGVLNQADNLKRSLERKKTHDYLNKCCFTDYFESIEHPSENTEKFGRYGISGPGRVGGISSVISPTRQNRPRKRRRRRTSPRKHLGTVSRPLPSDLCAEKVPKQPRRDPSASDHRLGATHSEANPRAHAGVGGSKCISIRRGNL